MKKNIKKHILKFLSAFTALCICASLLGGIGAFAAELDSRTTSVTLKANKLRNQVAVGDVMLVSVNLNIDDEATEGIFTLNMTLTYNPELLTLVEPEAPYNDIDPENPNYIQLGSILTDTSLTAEAGKSGKSITLLYGDANSNNICEDGSLAKLAFRANADLAVNNRIDAMIEVKDVRIFGRDILETDDSGNVVDAKVFEFTTDVKGWSGAIVPKFTAPKLTSVTIGETLKLLEYTTLTEEEGLLVEITGPDGAEDVVASAEAEIADGKYKAEFEIGEDYVPGKYKAVLTSGNTSATAEFTVKAKAEEPPVTEPDTDDDNTGDDNTGDDNTGDDNTGDDSTGDDSTGDDNNNGSSNSNGGKPNLPGSTTTVPNKSDEAKEDEGLVLPTDKEVIYPSDISGHWAEENIKYVYDNALMTGYEDGTFGAESNITRAEFATVMARLLGLEQNAAAAAFEDCAGHWAKGYIGALANAKIVGGVSDTEFAPDANITREQMAVILSRAFSLEEPFDSMAVFMDDEQISDWAYSDVYKVLNAGYMKGDDSGCFAPLANATRAEVATVIYRLHSQM